MSKKRILIIGMVWPEPASSAAGTRIIQLIDVFLSNTYEVVFASAASKSDFSYPLVELGVKEEPIKLNNESFDVFIKSFQPDIVIFDRFIVEEQYGWRITQECPHALRILDTEDLHFLRYARELALQTGEQPDLFTDRAKREIASILRCDLSLIISVAEIDILNEQFKIDSSLLFYLPFLEEEITEELKESWTDFDQREGFVFIGNFLHAPNWKTVQVLKTIIWPVLRKQLAGASMHIYGAYPSEKVMQLNNPKKNFRIHGRATNALEVVSKHRVLLAPIPFGAGVKGKFIDAMRVGTPTVTSTIGAEGMVGNLEWNGTITDDPDHFIHEAIKLHEDKTHWLKAQQNGVQLLNQNYGKTKFIQLFMEAIDILSVNIVQHRKHNFFGQILQHQSLSSTKYMSLWIAEKNKNGN